MSACKMLEGGRTRTRWLLELRLREQIFSCCQLCLLSGATEQTSNLLQTLILYWLLWQDISSYHQGLWPQEASEESELFKGMNNKLMCIVSVELFLLTVWMMGWGALSARFQGGNWAYAGRLLFTETLTCGRKGLAGTSWSFNKGTWGVLHLWWSNPIQH